MMVQRRIISVFASHSSRHEHILFFQMIRNTVPFKNGKVYLHCFMTPASLRAGVFSIVAIEWGYNEPMILYFARARTWYARTPLPIVLLIAGLLGGVSLTVVGAWSFVFVTLTSE